MPIRIIGAGLGGPEAAWQCARRGLAVSLYEMRPLRNTPAHETDLFAELVCSNSLKSDSENSAPWLLKEEMRHAASLLMELAHRLAPTRPPATLHFVGVEGVQFAEYGTELSPQVEAAIPLAVEAVLRVIGANDGLLAQGRAASSGTQARPATRVLPFRS